MTLIGYAIYVLVVAVCVFICFVAFISISKIQTSGDVTKIEERRKKEVIEEDRTISASASEMTVYIIPVQCTFCKENIELVDVEFVDSLTICCQNCGNHIEIGIEERP